MIVVIVLIVVVVNVLVVMVVVVVAGRRFYRRRSGSCTQCNNIINKAKIKNKNKPARLETKCASSPVSGGGGLVIAYMSNTSSVSKRKKTYHWQGSRRIYISSPMARVWCWSLLVAIGTVVS